MSTTTQYAEYGDQDNEAVETVLIDEFHMHSRRQLLPYPIRTAYIMVMGRVIQWLLGNIDFDELVDNIGTIADALKQVEGNVRGLQSVNHN